MGYTRGRDTIAYIRVQCILSATAASAAATSAEKLAYIRRTVIFPAAVNALEHYRR